MIKRLILILAFWIVPAVSAAAASFVATVDSDHVAAGKTVTLQLALSGANPAGDPDIGGLNQAFAIISEVSSSNISIVNGAAHSSVGWHVMMVPRGQGRIVIPAVSVATSAGTLRTAPVTIDVGPGGVPASSQVGKDGTRVTVTAQASTTTPHQNQSIQYTVRCVVRGSASDVSLSDIAVPGAIVEPIGKPDIHDGIENGAAAKIVEFHYIITPLQPGKMTLPPVTLRGRIEAPEPAPLNDPFGNGFSAAMRQAFHYFSSFGGEPFNVASNQIQLTVKPPAANMDPWLPLTSLKIMEDAGASQSVRVGEPWTRKLTLLADGAAGKQLPDLEAKQDHSNFKVYADTPATGEDIDVKTGGVLGWRKESYSLIALKPGRLVLPAIRVPWWDVVNNKAAVAELPARAINVLPAVGAANPPTMMIDVRPQSAKPGPQHAAGTPAFSLADFALLYVVIGLLAVGLVFVLLWRLAERRKVGRRGADISALVPELPASVAIRKLKDVRTAAELKIFLQAYANANWGASRNASPEMCFSAAKLDKGMADVEIVTKGIAGALYGGKVVDMEDLKTRCLRIIAKSRREASIRRRNLERLNSLNPS